MSPSSRAVAAEAARCAGLAVVDGAAGCREPRRGRLAARRRRALLVTTARREGEHGDEGEQGSHTGIYTAEDRVVARSSSTTAASSSGHSPTRRWPAAGSTRSGQRRRLCVLEAVLERDQPVAGAPDDRRRARHARKVRPWVVLQERPRRPFDVRVLRLRREEADHGFRGEDARVIRAPVAEDRSAQVRPPGQEKAEPRHLPRRSQSRDRGEPDLGAPGRGHDPGGCDENQRRDGLGPLDAKAQRDRPAHRVPEHRRRRHVLVLDDRGDVQCEVGQALELRQRLGPAVAGQVGNENAVPRRQERTEVGEVPRGAAEPVDEDERRPVTADPVARPEPGDLLDLPLEPPKERCRGHPGNRIL